LIEKEFKDIDQALRRAAQTAKKLSEKNGTPFVISEKKNAYTLKKQYFLLTISSEGL